LKIAANKYEAKKQVDRNKLIAVFGRDDDLTKNKRDRDVSVSTNSRVKIPGVVSKQ
jgi:hypothetical protein